MLRERIASARPRTVLALAWLALFLYGFPGQMIPDAFEHLGEARSGFYTDGSPPVISLRPALGAAFFLGDGDGCAVSTVVSNAARVRRRVVFMV